LKTEDVPLGKKISALKPDRQIVYEVGKKLMLRFLQEDKPSNCINFIKHDEFWKLVSEMRYTHKHLMDVTLVEKQEEFHNKLGTFGILASTNAIFLLKLTTDIEKKSFDLTYKLSLVSTLHTDTTDKEEKAMFYSELLTAFNEVEEQNVKIEQYLKSSRSDRKKKQESATKTPKELFACEVDSRIVSSCNLPFVVERICDSTEDYFLAEARAVSVQSKSPSPYLKGTQNTIHEHLLALPKLVPLFAEYLRIGTQSFAVSLAGTCLADGMSSLNYVNRMIMMKYLLVELSTIHSLKVIHNDIKPQNIVYHKQETFFVPKFIDFELMKTFVMRKKITVMIVLIR